MMYSISGAGFEPHELIFAVLFSADSYRGHGDSGFADGYH